jgi:L-alanine-DL-glutamate epimerase-like enolase superfamily enzyme
MRITAITATPVRLDIPYPLYPGEGAGTKIEWGRRSRFTPLRPTPMLEYVLVRIETDEGVTGWGEAQADIGFFGETVEQVRAAVADYLGPQLIGKDPLDREYLYRVMDYRGNGCAKSGIDMALHDLAGKVMGVPVSVLLGGRRRTRVPVAIEVPGGKPEAMAQACVALMRQGVCAFKPKVGGYPEADAERMRAIREAVGPEVSLRADANQGYSPKEAVQFCRLCERYGVGLELLEQPVAAHDLPGMAYVRRSVDTLIEADESCFTPQDALAIIRHEAADVLNIKLGKAGGFTQAKKIAALAEAAGLKCVMGTAFGLGLEIAAKAHLFAATEIVTDAVEFTELSLHGNLLKPPWDARFALPLEDGCLPVPDGPGLGVEVDLPQAGKAAPSAIP